jgi:hypothetical protein
LKAESIAERAAMARVKVPDSIASRSSPTGEEIPLWKFSQLDIIEKDSLKKRALELKTILSSHNFGDAHKKFCEACRTHGEKQKTILWILHGQALLLSSLGHSVSAYDFGFPLPADYEQEQAVEVFSGQLPSIKMTKETIHSHWPKAGPTMHDP